MTTLSHVMRLAQDAKVTLSLKEDGRINMKPRKNVTNELRTAIKETKAHLQKYIEVRDRHPERAGILEELSLSGVTVRQREDGTLTASPREMLTPVLMQRMDEEKDFLREFLFEADGDEVIESEEEARLVIRTRFDAIYPAPEAPMTKEEYSRAHAAISEKGRFFREKGGALDAQEEDR